jgi:hypothetical protein
MPACLFSLQSHDNLNPNYLHHPANCFAGAILCTFVCSDRNYVWNDGIGGTSKSRIDSEIATKSPWYEQRGKIPFGSPKYRQQGETVIGSQMYGESLQRPVVFRRDQQSSQAVSRRIHALEASVSKMEGKLCALCLELKQVQQILITDTNKFSAYMPNVSHHVEVEAEKHQSLEDPLVEMVKILVPNCACLSPNSLVDLMVRPRP